MQVKSIANCTVCLFTNSRCGLDLLYGWLLKWRLVRLSIVLYHYASLNRFISFVLFSSALVRCHIVLRGLRDEKEEGYFIPQVAKFHKLFPLPAKLAVKLLQGGLFEFISCPHYFCDAIGWFGAALCIRHLFAWTLALQV
eukprot:SAG31_NODE_2781_length_5095_cov_9.452162_4_plen_140_part_00